VLQANPFVVRGPNYGVASIDRPFVFNSSYTYQTGHFGFGGQWIENALSGWTISGISTWQAGGSLLALLGNSVPNFGLTESYINLPANAKAQGISNGISSASYYGTDAALAIQPVLTCNPNHGLAKYQRLNGSCFAAPALGGTDAMGQFGGQKYPYMSMGSYFDNDLALYKSFKLKGTQSVQFRASAFDWLNHALPEFSSGNQVTLRYLTDYNTKAITLNKGTGGTVSDFGTMDTKTGGPYERIIELNVQYSF
jgi:hypothetical protein